MRIGEAYEKIDKYGCLYDQANIPLPNWVKEETEKIQYYKNKLKDLLAKSNN